MLERRWISSRKVSRIVTVAKAGQSGLPATGGVVAARARRLADPPPPARRVCHGLALAALTLAIAASAFLPAFAVTGI